jgi:hypothetical protein
MHKFHLLAHTSEGAAVFLRCTPQLGLYRGHQGWLYRMALGTDAEHHDRAALDSLVRVYFPGLLIHGRPCLGMMDLPPLLGMTHDVEPTPTPVW